MKTAELEDGWHQQRLARGMVEPAEREDFWDRQQPARTMDVQENCSSVEKAVVRDTLSYLIN